MLCGPSGGGKSTLLRLLQGIVPQRSGGDLDGSATVLDLDVTRVPPHALAAAGVTLLYQNPLEGFVAERVSDEVAFGPESLGLAAGEVGARVEAALADVGLDTADRRPLAALSGGEQQRVALAAALALRPAVLLLDEPTAHLDEEGAVRLLALLDRIRRSRGVTCVVAEHRLGAAAPFADRIAVIVDGAIRAAGPPRLALADPGLAGLGVPVPRATQAALALGLTGELPLGPGELASRAGGGGPTTSARPIAAGPGADVALRLEGVGYRYPGRLSDALADVDLTVRRGERVALVGPSGAGKSTLARVAVGLRAPTAGRRTVLGVRDARLGQVAERVGLVVQNPLRQILADTVEREVATGLRGLPPADARARVDEALERFGLAALRDRHPLLLSEGQRRRVTLAAALARRPELLVLDEPTLAQDEAQRAALAALVRELAAGGTAVLAATHDREFVNDACERVVVLRAGRVVADLPLGGDAVTAAALAGAGVALADVPATVRLLAARGVAIEARTVDELVAAVSG